MSTWALFKCIERRAGKAERIDERMRGCRTNDWVGWAAAVCVCVWGWIESWFLIQRVQCAIDAHSKSQAAATCTKIVQQWTALCAAQRAKLIRLGALLWLEMTADARSAWLKHVAFDGGRHSASPLCNQILCSSDMSFMQMELARAPFYLQHRAK